MPKCRAMRRAMVLLPAPAGPSIAMIMWRRSSRTDIGADAVHQRGEAGEAGFDRGAVVDPGRRLRRHAHHQERHGDAMVRLSPSTATVTPHAARPVAIALSRSLSLTRSSLRPCIVVRPLAKAAATPRIGYS